MASRAVPVTAIRGGQVVIRPATRVVRRLGAVAATALLAFGGVVATGSPAQAVPPGCYLSASYYVDGGQNIHAFRSWLCDSGNDIPLTVEIKRFVSPGVW